MFLLQLSTYPMPFSHPYTIGFQTHHFAMNKCFREVPKNNFQKSSTKFIGRYSQLGGWVGEKATPSTEKKMETLNCGRVRPHSPGSPATGAIFVQKNGWAFGDTEPEKDLRLNGWNLEIAGSEVGKFKWFLGVIRSFSGDKSNG